jgi:hypothetical protein
MEREEGARAESARVVSVLSHDVWSVVASFCDASSLRALRACSRALCALCSRSSFWQRAVAALLRCSALPACVLPGTALSFLRVANLIQAHKHRFVGEEELRQLLLQQDLAPLTVFVSSKLDLQMICFVRRPVRLIGLASVRPVVSCPPGVTFSIMTNNVSMENLSFVASENPHRIVMQVEVDGSVNVSDCDFSTSHNVDLAILVIEASSSMLHGDHEIVVQPELSTRVTVSDSRFVGFGTTISGAVDDSMIRGACSGSIKGCVFEKCEFGLMHDGRGVWEMRDCVFSEIGDRAISVSSVDSMLVEDCQFLRARRGCHGGLFVYDSPLLWVRRCRFEKAGPAAVYLTNVIETTLEGVHVSGSPEALTCMAQVVSVYESDEEGESDDAEDVEDDDEDDEEENGGDEMMDAGDEEGNDDQMPMDVGDDGPAAGGEANIMMHEFDGEVLRRIVVRKSKESMMDEPIVLNVSELEVVNGLCNVSARGQVNLRKCSFRFRGERKKKCAFFSFFSSM